MAPPCGIYYKLWKPCGIYYKLWIIIIFIQYVRVMIMLMMICIVLVRFDGMECYVYLVGRMDFDYCVVNRLLDEVSDAVSCQCSWCTWFYCCPKWLQNKIHVIYKHHPNFRFVICHPGQLLQCTVLVSIFPPMLFFKLLFNVFQVR